MDIGYKINYVKSLWKRYGFRGLAMKTLERTVSPMRAYSRCYQRFMPSVEELKVQRETPLSHRPLVSIVVPAYETAEAFLRELIMSVKEQTYKEWELCIADGSKSLHVKEIVQSYQKEDGRIKYLALTRNGGISENTNAGFAMAKGEYIAMMDHDDIISPNALYEMVKCLGEKYNKDQRKYALIYSDEDKIDSTGTVHSRPHFKPDFNPEFLRRNNYFCHFLMFSAVLLDETGGLRAEYDGAQDYDFVMRCVEAGAVVSHVPKILYHWRIHQGSTAGNSADKAYAFDSGCRAIEGHLMRIGQPGTAQTTANLGVYRVAYELKGSYRVTVLTEDKEELKRIRAYYKNVSCCQKENTLGYFIDIHYLLADQLTGAVQEACIGDYVLYVRKGTQPTLEQFLENLLSICQHKQVGIVSAKLYTKKKKVASCGMIYNEDGELVQSLGGIPAEYKGYFLHAVIPQNVSAVSLSCALIKREAYRICGGEDGNLKGLYQDADICFRMQEKGYQIITAAEAGAVTDMDWKKRQKPEQIFMNKWKAKLSVPDACYNSNLSTQPGHTYSMKD